MEKKSIFLAHGINSMFCGKRCMLSRFTVMVCVSIAVVGGKLIFLSGRPRDLWRCILPNFVWSTRELLQPFYDCSSFGSLGEVFVHGAEFPLRLAFLRVVV